MVHGWSWPVRVQHETASLSVHEHSASVLAPRGMRRGSTRQQLNSNTTQRNSTQLKLSLNSSNKQTEKHTPMFTDGAKPTKLLVAAEKTRWLERRTLEDTFHSATRLCRASGSTPHQVLTGTTSRCNLHSIHTSSLLEGQRYAQLHAASRPSHSLHAGHAT